MHPGWFGVAVHALAMLARSDSLCPSTMIADNVKSHAVFLRRVLALLVRARIVEAREGRDGGYRLGRPADCITLADVYRAVKAAGAPVAVESCDPLEVAVPQECSSALHRAFDEVIAETEERMLAVLEGYTIADLLKRADILDRVR